MPHRHVRSQRWIADGFVLTVDRDGLHIEVTDYHAKPLHLGWTKLAELGLAIRSEKAVQRRSSGEPDAHAPREEEV